jgi:hypothetical protein
MTPLPCPISSWPEPGTTADATGGSQTGTLAAVAGASAVCTGGAMARQTGGGCCASTGTAVTARAPIPSRLGRPLR